MQGFHEFEGGDLEEFDWFPEETVEKEGFEDYAGLVDLKEAVGSLARDAVDAGLEERRVFVCGEIEEDGLMWRYGETLAAAMGNAFSAVCEKLCGRAFPETTGLISDYIERLGRDCEIIQSELHGAEAFPEPENGVHQEAIARIDACLSEHGGVLALVSDEQWRELAGEAEMSFADSGVRTLQVIGLKGEAVIVNDFADIKGSGVAVSRQDFCGLYGILLEVYK